MKIQAKKIRTPIGILEAPLSPNFHNELAKCETNEDLFKMAESKWGHINPDVFNEIETRGLLDEYIAWTKKN